MSPDIDLHCLSLESDRNDLAALLTDAERRRADKFRFDRHRREFIARRAFLRELLGKYLDTDPRFLEFASNEFGKPAVKGAALHFSVSHSAGLALYAISRTREIGVDIERIDPAFTHDRISEHFFGPAEAAALRALPGVLRTEAFFRCWTRKEAYLKARGIGLSLPLDSFDVSSDQLGDWRIETLTPAPGYIAALASRSQ